MRKEIKGLKEKHKKDIEHVKQTMLPLLETDQKDTKDKKCYTRSNISVKVQEKGYPVACNPIGYIQSVFKSKNGIPRQSGVCEQSKAILSIGADIFNNPQHSLEGLESFSHVWVIFVFHKNNNEYTKAKVKPPRLNGKKVGLFSTRCPYRPNPVGLSLVKLDQITGSTLHLSGVDLLDGTPVIDIKPYIPEYDQPRHCLTTEPNNSGGLDQSDDYSAKKSTEHASLELKLSQDSSYKVKNTDCQNNSAEDNTQSNFDDSVSTNHEYIVKNHEHACVNKDDLTTPESFEESHCNGEGHKISKVVHESEVDSSSQVVIAKWVSAPPIEELRVRFTQTADEELTYFRKYREKTYESDKQVLNDVQNSDDLEAASNIVYELQYMDNSNDVKDAIVKILKSDPRSTYRRNKCKDRLYYFTVDTVHVTCWFDDLQNTAEIVKLQPVQGL